MSRIIFSVFFTKISSLCFIRLSFVIGTFLFISYSYDCQAKNYVVFAISQDVPMGIPQEVLHKNFYINMGQQQGLKIGTILDAYRITSISDPFDYNSQREFKTFVGQLEVIHSQPTESIARTISLQEKGKNIKQLPQVDVKGIMIGDQIHIHL